MKCVLCGSGRFGAAVLKMVLASGWQVGAIFCPFDGRGDSLFGQADLSGLPLFKAGSLRADTLGDGVDLIIAAHSHDFIGRKSRMRARLGAIGYHPSLLPLHRGRDAVRWTVRDRDKVAGGSVYWLTDTVDGGPIAAQDWCFVRPDDTASELWRRELFPMGVRLLAETLKNISAGTLVQVPQDRSLATWEPAMVGGPRLFRPELELLGQAPSGVKIVRERLALRGS